MEEEEDIELYQFNPRILGRGDLNNSAEFEDEGAEDEDLPSMSESESEDWSGEIATEEQSETSVLDTDDENEDSQVESDEDEGLDSNGEVHSHYHEADYEAYPEVNDLDNE